MTTADLRTPALLVDVAALEANADAMAARRPGAALRPHVKAFKSTRLARWLADRCGHTSSCAATLGEVAGLADAGLGHDVLLANETLDVDRLRSLASRDDLRLTVAVDSDETLAAAVAAGVNQVLVDVDVGLPRCGCEPSEAPRLADAARAAGLAVRGVMGYEGQCQDWVEVERRRAEVDRAMAVLAAAHAEVGGDVVSAGGTGTHALNEVATEIQAGSYLLMDTHYARLGDLPFTPALSVLATVVSARVRPGGWYVLDAGLKALAMDHGNPTAEVGEVFFCSDEHTTVLAEPELGVRVGDRMRLRPAHVDPTVAKHPRLHLVDGDEVVDVWPVDLRDW